MRGLKWVGGLAIVALSAGCLATERAQAHDQMSEVRESIRLAEMRGDCDARAVQQLNQARRELRDAHSFAPDHTFCAMSAMNCAQADTELALALEDEARARAEDRRVTG